jgi:sterol 3beta-glucosyltransferase
LRFVLITFGTRGDVTPFVALGRRLRSAGHDVRIVTHAEFEPLTARHDLEFRAVPASYQEFVATGEGRRALGAPRGTPMGLLNLFRPFSSCAETTYQNAWIAAEHAEGIVCSSIAWPVASLVAARRGVRLAWVQAVPAAPTGATPHPAFPAWPLGSIYNKATHAAGRFLIRRGASDVFERWRREAARLGNGSPSTEAAAVGLIAVSPHVSPRPSDWPDAIHVTGYWFLHDTEAEMAVPDSLRGFVEAGPAPICLGFGSMMDDHPDQLRAVVLEAINRLGLRAVIVGGSGGALIGFNHRNVCEVPFASYGWLFPRMRAVVHQGGAGTASFCLTAGVPQIIVRYCLDQNFWAWRMNALGVAPPSLLRQTLTANDLAAAIRRVMSDGRFKINAERLAPLIRQEDGLDIAVRIMTDHFER